LSACPLEANLCGVFGRLLVALLDITQAEASLARLDSPVKPRAETLEGLQEEGARRSRLKKADQQASSSGTRRSVSSTAVQARGSLRTG
jgi:hypothetical protein